MKTKRQDLTFLGLAVAVLVIALTLFIGLRALPRKSPEPTPKFKPRIAAPRPDKKMALPTANRDPFASREKKALIPPANAATSSTVATEGIRLVGIIQGRPPMAVIRKGDHRYYVKVGGRVGDYKVTAIATLHVVLSKNGERLTLNLGK